MLVPNLLNVVLNAWWPIASWSVDWELHVETHVGFATSNSRVILKSQVNWWCLERSSIILPVVKGEGALNLLGPRNSLSNAVDFSLQVLLATNAATVLIANKAVGLKRGMLVRGAGSGIVIDSLFVIQFRALVNVISLGKWERALSLVPLLNHLALSRLDVIASINDRPADSDVFWRKVRVLTKTQRGLVKVIASFASNISSTMPRLIGGIQLLLDNRSVVLTLRGVFVSEYTGHA